VPVVLTYEKKAFERKQGEATGFIRGLKVCQSHLFDKEREKHGGVHLVEDANPEIWGHWPEKEA
jgi:hypothetical protein